MNEFVGKKLGEVLAFSRLGVELFERGETALKTMFEDYDRVVENFRKQAGEVEQAAAAGEVTGTAADKAEATLGKLRGMMVTYIGDQWDNPAELLEWMGFFEGAAIVHWRLVEGAASELGNDSLHELAQFGVNLHDGLLTRAQEAITQIGASRAKE